MANKTPEPDYELAQPEPAALIESLRAFGYSLRTAVADLIDNSISAKAKNVWVQFEWNGPDSWIAITDDGDGMSDSDISRAMRPGSKSPLEQRSPKDLGRFGLGLKTASFSQCRSVTVVSRQKGSGVVSRCWDLDYVNSKREWRLLKTVDPMAARLLNGKAKEKGTTVLWQRLDRVTGQANVEDKKAFDQFLEAADLVKRHLEMVFHRYLDRSGGLAIWVNDRRVTPWDPFLKDEKATQELPPEKLPCAGGQLRVVPYVLPHQSKVAPAVYSAAAGYQGWNAQQGFYVYRNERLLVGGDWLGLGFQKDEIHKLARIQIDLPNSMDAEWQIDVKKSRAKPPGPLRSDLKRIAMLTRDAAQQVFSHRGKVVSRQNSQSFIFAWEQRRRHGKIIYSVNRDHPLVLQAYRSGNREQVDALLSLLEESIPISHMLIASAGEPEKFSTPYENSPPELLKNVLLSSYSALVNSGVSPTDARKRLLAMDPFNLFPESVGEALSTLGQE